MKPFASVSFGSMLLLSLALQTSAEMFDIADKCQLESSKGGDRDDLLSRFYNQISMTIHRQPGAEKNTIGRFHKQHYWTGKCGATEAEQYDNEMDLNLCLLNHHGELHSARNGSGLKSCSDCELASVEKDGPQDLVCKCKRFPSDSEGVEARINLRDVLKVDGSGYVWCQGHRSRKSL